MTVTKELIVRWSSYMALKFYLRNLYALSYCRPVELRKHGCAAGPVHWVRQKQRSKVQGAGLLQQTGLGCQLF